VVLVAVGQKDPRDAIAKRVERREVGMHDVHAESPVVERHPAVDEDDLSALLDRKAVHAYLAQPTERKNAHRHRRRVVSPRAARRPRVMAIAPERLRAARSRVSCGAPPRSVMTPLEHRRFVIVTGKGGVGKTTVSAALAVHWAEKGKRVLVAMC